MAKTQSFHYQLDETDYEISVRFNRLTGGVRMTINRDEYRLPGKFFGSRNRQDFFLLGDHRAVLTVKRGIAAIEIVGE